MNEYLMILHEPMDSPFAALSPEEVQSVIARYGTWADRMAAAGRLRGGQKLEDGTARHMAGGTVTDGPYPETKEVIGGYFLITAESYDDAVALAGDCPHLEFGRIEIRRIDETA